MQPQMRWSKNPRQNLGGSFFAIGNFSKSRSRCDANGGGRGRSRDPSFAKTREKKRRVNGLCVLQKKTSGHWDGVQALAATTQRTIRSGSRIGFRRIAK